MSDTSPTSTAVRSLTTFGIDYDSQELRTSLQNALLVNFKCERVEFTEDRWDDVIRVTVIPPLTGLERMDAFWYARGHIDGFLAAKPSERL